MSVFTPPEVIKEMEAAEKEWEELMSHRFRYADESDEEEDGGVGEHGDQVQERGKSPNKDKVPKVVFNAGYEMIGETVEKDSSTCPADVTATVRLPQEGSPMIACLTELHIKLKVLMKMLNRTKSTNSNFDCEMMLVLYLERESRDIFNDRVKRPSKELVVPSNKSRDEYIAMKTTSLMLLLRDLLIQKVVGRDQLKGLPHINNLFVRLFNDFKLPLNEWTMETPEEMFKRYAHLHRTLCKGKHNKLGHGKTTSSYAKENQSQDQHVRRTESSKRGH